MTAGSHTADVTTRPRHVALYALPYHGIAIPLSDTSPHAVIALTVVVILVIVVLRSWS